MNKFNPKLITLLPLAAQYIAQNFLKASPSVKNVIRTLRYRSCWYSDDHEELDRIFQGLPDPWNFESSPYEQARLQLLLRMAAGLPHATVCDVGCAEGIFTQMLSGISRHVTGIDVSPTAIARARERSPQPKYVVTSLDSFQPRERFDLVICSETLYYMQNVSSAITKLSALGRFCMVSYIGREAKILDRHFKSRPNVRMEQFTLGTAPLKRTIRIVVWENPVGRSTT